MAERGEQAIKEANLRWAEKPQTLSSFGSHNRYATLSPSGGDSGFTDNRLPRKCRNGRIDLDWLQWRGGL